MNKEKYFELLAHAATPDLETEAGRAEAIDTLHEAMLLLDNDQPHEPVSNLHPIFAGLTAQFRS